VNKLRQKYQVGSAKVVAGVAAYQATKKTAEAVADFACHEYRDHCDYAYD
jgi:hypothetical protein